MNLEKLTKRVENTFEERQRYEDIEKQRQARLKEVTEAPQFTKMDFWCNKHSDSTGMAFKCVFTTREDGLCAFYESFGYGFPREMLACCKGLRRHITDKLWDNYYRDSAKIQLDAKIAIANGDLLQPGDYGFRTKYGDPNKKLYEQLEQEEKAKWELKNAK